MRKLSLIAAGLFAGNGFVVPAPMKAATVTVTSTGTSQIDWKQTEIIFLPVSKTIGGATAGNQNWSSGDSITFTGTGANIVLSITSLIGATNIDMQGGVLTFASTGFQVSGDQLTTGTIAVTNAGDVATISGNIADSAVDFSKTGAGTLVLSGSNVFKSLTLAAGTLRASSAGALGSSGTLTFSGGTLQYGAGIATDYSARFATATGQQFRLDTNGNDVSLATAFGGSAGNTNTLTKSGSGTLTLSTANTYLGGTTLAGGVLQINSASSLGASGTLTFTGGTLRYGTGITTDLSSRFSAATGQQFNLDTNGNAVTLATTFGGPGGNTNTFTKSGSGALTLTTATTYTGATTISGGTLKLGDGASLGTGAGGVVDNAALEFINTAALTLANNISGSGGVTQSGSGTTTLSGSGGYTGATAVNAGTLLVNGTSAATAVTVASGATFGGSGTVGAITLNSGAFLSPGTTAGASVGTLSAGSLLWNGGGALRFNLGAASTGDRLSFSGALTKGSAGTYAFDFLNTGGTGAYTLITAGSLSGFTASNFTYTNLGSGLSGVFSFSGNNLVLTVIPEPACLTAAGLGLIPLMLIRRRRHARTEPVEDTPA